MNRIVIIFLFLSFFCSPISKSQVIQIKYKEAVKLGPSVNSEAEEAYPLISSDGTKLYFTRALSRENIGSIKGGQDIWVSDINGQKYSTANNSFPKLNNKANNAIVGISSDGTRLYLLNVYKTEKHMKAGISFTTNQESGWSEPEEIKIPGLNIEGNNFGFWMNPEGDTLLISAFNNDSRGKEDIFVSLKKDGKWCKPINLGSQINSYGYEISPFLDKDGKTLYYSSAGKGGYGSADVYMSTRLNDSWTSWSYPKNLGKPINSRDFDAYFSVHGNTAYFSSNRNSELSNIFIAEVVRLKPGERLKDLPKAQKVYFKLNDYLLYPEQKDVLSDIVKLLEDDYDLNVIVSGYTCDIGDNKTNEKLSGLRAESVLTYFVIMGIDESRIKVKHYGEIEAQKLNETEQDKKLKRRVDIKFGWED